MSINNNLLKKKKVNKKTKTSAVHTQLFSNINNNIRPELIFQAIETTLDGISLLDNNKIFLYINKSFLKIFGYDNEDEIIGSTCKKIFNNKEYKRLNSYILPKLFEKGSWKGEAYGLRKDETLIPIEISLSKDTNNNIICITRDISKRKEVERIIDETTERHQTLFNSSPLPILLINPYNGKIIDYNQAAYKELGYSKKSFNELYINEIEIIEKKDFILRRLKQILKSENEQFETIFQTYKGELRNFKIDARSITINKDSFVQYICKDITEEKRLTTEIIESESRYKALVEKSNDAIFIYQKQKFIYFNPQTVKLTGYSEQELELMNPLTLFDENSQKNLESIFANFINRLKYKPIIEAQLTKKDNTVIWVEVSINIIPYKKSLAGLFSIRDINERKQLEIAYKQLVENSIQTLVIYQNRKAVFANKNIEKITGYKPEEFINFSPDEIINIVHPKDKELIYKYLRARAISNNPPQKFEHRIISKNGDIKWLEVIANKIYYQGKPAVQAAYNDITERKNAESALLESEAKYKILIENAFDGIFLIKNNRFSYINPKFCEMSGYSVNEILDEKFQIKQLFTTKSYNLLHKKMSFDNVFFQNRGTLELELITKQHNKIYVELSLSPIGDKEKKEYLGILRNISERKKIEEEMRNLIVSLHISKDLTEERAREIEILNKKLQESEKNLKELNVNKDKFFSIIAHDLKGPFSGFLGLSKILSQDLSLLTTEEIQDIAKDLHESAENLFRLLENLLEWSRIQRKSISYNPEKIIIDEIVKLNIGLLSTNAKQKNIQILNLTDENHIAYADANSLNTILRNLISNAIKFTKSNGNIVISSEITDDSNIVISIKDSGIGIPPEVQTKLFRIDSHYTSEGTNKEKGTGLGLILCKELVEMNNGKIWFISEKNVGTTFYFTLPLFIE